MTNNSASGFRLHPACRQAGASGYVFKHAACGMRHAARTYILLTLGLSLLSLIGCARSSYVKTPSPAETPGIYHRVEKGETLWRVSKIYDVDLQTLVEINRINDAANIETGQFIFIPHRQKQKFVSAKHSAGDFIWPIKGKVILTFGQTRNFIINEGLNIQPRKKEDVRAASSGKVVFYSPNFKGFGQTLIIEHGDGFSTVYARNSEVFVKTGDNVEKGSVISKVGSAGRDKDKYLHFEIRKGHIPQNPYFYLPR